MTLFATGYPHHTPLVPGLCAMWTTVTSTAPCQLRPGATGASLVPRIVHKPVPSPNQAFTASQRFSSHYSIIHAVQRNLRRCLLPRPALPRPSSSNSAAEPLQHPKPSEQYLDNLAEDDNIILLGSEDEEENDMLSDASNSWDNKSSAAKAAAEAAATIQGRVISSDTSEDDFVSAMAAAQQQVVSGSSSSGEDDDVWGQDEDEEDSMRRSGEDFWSTDKERVYLVGVTYKHQYQHQQQRRQQQQQRQSSASSSTSSSNGSSWNAATAVADAGAAGSSSSKQPSVTYSVHESLEELGRLAETAGLKVVGSSYQQLEAPNNATYIGSGKVAEVTKAINALKVDTVIFDDELSPGQLRNLEKAFTGGAGGATVGVADRTALILDIFSQRARTREGKLQVDLAQTEYQLPRLTRMWTHLDRVAGGGQVKGTGEKQIEIDKRLLRDKAAALRRELQAVRTHRAAHRTRRSDAPIPVVALVGYTNAGKSTLLNTMTAAGVLAEDKLFATLDPTTRKVRLDGNLEVLFSDTVGFIQKLPTQLVAAFRATLEEIAAASVVLHVLDVSAPNAAAQCAAVLQVLEELGVQDLPLVTAWNKIDACPNPDAVRALAASRKDTVAISGATSEGLDDLMMAIAEKLAESMVEMEVLLPYSAGALLDDLHKMGKVTHTLYTEQGTCVTAHVPRNLVGKLKQYSVNGMVAAAAADAGSGSISTDLDGSDMLDDGDHGQTSSHAFDDGFFTDHEVDDASMEDVQLQMVDAWQYGSADNGQQLHHQAKEGYQPHVAGSRAGKRAAQQRKQQQGSLAAHQLPADWQDVLMSGSEFSTLVPSL